jgi:N-acetylglucosamine-6-sulfatase
MAQNSSAGPNHLLIITDDQPHFMQNASITPKIAAQIANAGLKWVQGSWANIPVCGPARATIFTGKLAHNHGVWTNASYEGGGIHTAFKDLEDDTIATRLKAKGVRCGIFGKYQNGYPAYVKNSDGSFNEGRAVPPPGWDRFVIILAEDGDAEETFRVNRHGVEWRPTWANTDTALISSEIRNWLTASEQLSAPWFAIMATQSPHDPYRPSLEHADDYDGVQLPNWASYNEADMSDKPQELRAQPNITDPGGLDHSELRQWYEGKLEEIRDVDDAVGEVVQALTDSGQLNNTYVWFTSDNGYMFGHHRLARKEQPYEESARVPFIVRGPGVPVGKFVGQTSLAGPWTGHIDIPRTILSTYDADLSGTDGRDLRYVFHAGGAKPSGWRNRMLLEMNTEWSGGAVAPAGARIWQAMVRQKAAHYKAIRRPPWGPSWEFYNLDNDLVENNSITATMSSTLKQTLKDELLAALALSGDAYRNWEAA